MDLAEGDGLSFCEIQLLADCFQPVYAVELPAVAATLIRRALLHLSRVRDDNSHGCYFRLEVTDRGRFCAEQWLERHEKGEASSAARLALRDTA